MLNKRLSLLFYQFSRLRRDRRTQNIVNFTLLILGPILALITAIGIGETELSKFTPFMRLIVFLDLTYVLIVLTFIVQRIINLYTARKSKSAGADLHLRLSGIFALSALIPAVILGVFSALIINYGLERWFSDRVRKAVDSSLIAAEAYEDEHLHNMRSDTILLAQYLSRQLGQYANKGQMRITLEHGQKNIQRALKEAYIIDSKREILARGDRSYLFNYDIPASSQIRAASEGSVEIIKDYPNNEIRSLIKIPNMNNRFLYVTREVEGNIISLVAETRESASLYQQSEAERSRLALEFAAIYFGFALIIVVAAILLGLLFAERLSRPIGRLTGAAERVASGDLNVRVREENTNDDIGMLSSSFNKMTSKLKEQRDGLIDAHEETDRRRRLFDSVLSGVSAGVIGLDAQGHVEVSNLAAYDLLGHREVHKVGAKLVDIIPEFEPLFEKLATKETEAQAEIHITVENALKNFLVRIVKRRTSDGTLEGYVVTFDDVTELATAQRMAAWGEVARRIAHEIKNPLTPIKLSADRMRRKYGPMIEHEREKFEDLASVIVRQTDDLRRIVDEFSKFARMPEVQLKRVNLAHLVNNVLTLQRLADKDVEIKYIKPQDQIELDLDETLFSQAVTNLVKNAIEATQTYKEDKIHPDYKAEIRVTLNLENQTVFLTIEDNGVGLPADRARLFEPYVTNRKDGTGLGLSIVKKIIEEHGGLLELLDAAPFYADSHCGAMAKITLPVA